ncbi:GH1 family beta-glucosidase [Carboxylicivirga sp. RSCT41]|uniref:GH1 family beta-glucosidase n=1 Tax=Carboxylicivirga agarovorans TaxID=3417570 RepID=UPI003D328B7A
MFKREQFGDNFKWGVTISAFQNEGAPKSDGKGPSIWDTFTANTNNINNGDAIGDACDFYNRYEEDIALVRTLGLDVFRFSISWARILPYGRGKVNQAGIDFYKRVIDCCISNDLTPYVTIYHWDLPQALDDKGGWTNREIVDWFIAYLEICVKAFGDKVSNWVVMNEPMSFTGLGYFMGYHAPSRKGINHFLKAAHHTVLCMAQGGAKIRELQPHANIGVALSCSYIKPVNQLPKHRRAAKRMQAMLNRFYLEPLLGLGYPTDVMPALKIIKTFFRKGDEERMVFDFDFIGIQYYFRVVARHSYTPPVLFADEIPPRARKANLNTMNLDVYPKGIYKLLKFYSSYPQIKELIVTESGVCYPDFLVKDHVYDVRRMKYHQKMLKYIRKAQQKGINAGGYFVWTLVDNFEWKEGFEPRFGLVHVDFETQQRTIKYSGKWFQSFLSKTASTN